jgi:hypothetical protein
MYCIYIYNCIYTYIIELYIYNYIYYLFLISPLYLCDSDLPEVVSLLGAFEGVDPEVRRPEMRNSKV